MAVSFSIADIAKELNVSQTTLRNWLKTGAAGDGSIDSLRSLARERLTRRANKVNATAPRGRSASNSLRNRSRKSISNSPIVWEIIDRLIAFHTSEIQKNSANEAVSQSSQALDSENFVSSRTALSAQKNVGRNKKNGKKEYVEISVVGGGKSLVDASIPRTPPATEGLLFLSVRQFILSLFAARRKSCPTLIEQELSDWEASLIESAKEEFSAISKSFAGIQNDLFSENALPILFDVDFAGILYQELSRVGLKSWRGAFYTPLKLTEETVAGLPISSEACFLDPCCGSGAFLLAAQKRLGFPLASLFGLDLDPVAVRLARLNLLLNSPESIEKPQIVCWDGLREELPETFPTRFDWIATNPPWGASSVDGRKEETFTRFLRRGWDALKDGGEALFLLPEAFLNIRAHASTRRFLLENTRILQVEELGRAFPEVFTPVVRLRFAKSVDKKAAIPEKTNMNQNVFLRTSGNIISPCLTPEIAQIVNKMFSAPHETLKDHAVWGLGIVTGNNARWLRKITDSSSEVVRDHAWEEDVLVQENAGSAKDVADSEEVGSAKAAEDSEKVGNAKAADGEPGVQSAFRWSASFEESFFWEPIIRGRDIEPYRIRPPETEINFRPELFQQTLPEGRYRVPEKIVYRFISSRPVFALDTEKRLTLNSANFLVPQIPEMSAKVTLAFLNSDAFCFLFQTMFFTRKILRGDLETLPFPKISEKIAENLENLVGDIFSEKAVCAKINEIVFSAFALTRAEIQIVRRGLEQASERS